MTFYHGTTLDAAQSIKRQGLIPHRETAYQLEANGIKLRDVASEKLPYIYLETRRDMAEMYASFRAKYNRAGKGEAIDGGGIFRPIKLTDTRDESAKPAVITLDIPLAVARQFKTDPQETRGGHVCLCVIPPRYIKSVEELPA